MPAPIQTEGHVLDRHGGAPSGENARCSGGQQQVTMTEANTVASSGLVA